MERSKFRDYNDKACRVIHKGTRTASFDHKKGHHNEFTRRGGGGGMGAIVKNQPKTKVLNKKID